MKQKLKCKFCKKTFIDIIGQDKNNAICDNCVNGNVRIIKTSWFSLVVLILLTALLISCFMLKVVLFERELKSITVIKIERQEIIEEPEILPAIPQPKKILSLKASYYVNNCCGKDVCITANGEVYDDSQLTAACNLVPLGTILNVQHKEKEITVRVNDRISKKYGNSRIDLSKGAFAKLGNLEAGLLNVKVLIN